VIVALALITMLMATLLVNYRVAWRRPAAVGSAA
jgi:simple sugar transport system permease protein